MATVSRTAGAAGSIVLTTKNSGGSLITPVSTPVVAWYTDAGRTLGVLTLPVTGSGSSYTATWTGAQAPAIAATRYLKVTIETATGVFSVDADDDVSFLLAGSSITTPSLVSLAEAKLHLNIPAATTTWDAELQGFCDAVQSVVEDIAGPIVLRSIANEVHDGGQESIVTRFAPVVSITSVTEYIGTAPYVLTSQPLGSTTNAYGYELLDASGLIVRRGASGVPTPFLGGCEGVVVSYVAGYASLPSAVRLGALELVRHWWQRSQQGGRPGFNSAADDGGYISSGNYLVPYFVAELLSSMPYTPKKIPGIA